MLLSVLIRFYGKKNKRARVLRSARSSFLLFPIKKENRQRLYNLLSIFILKLIDADLRSSELDLICTAVKEKLRTFTCKFDLLIPRDADRIRFSIN